MKFLDIFEENRKFILQGRMEFESNFDIERAACRELRSGIFENDGNEI